MNKVYSMNLKQRLADFIVKRRESALLGQVFQQNSRLSRLAYLNFQHAVEARGIKLGEALLRQAREAIVADRSLTIGDFLDQQLKNEKPSRLRWGKR